MGDKKRNGFFFLFKFNALPVSDQFLCVFADLLDQLNLKSLFSQLLSFLRVSHNVLLFVWFYILDNRVLQRENAAMLVRRYFKVIKSLILERIRWATPCIFWSLDRTFLEHVSVLDMVCVILPIFLYNVALI